MSAIADTFVRSYWLNVFGKWKPSDQTLAVASVQNKIRPFIMHPLLRAILGQPRNRLDLREIMDQGRILIVDLSKGKIREDASTLLGALLVTKLQLAAMTAEWKVPAIIEIPKWVLRLEQQTATTEVADAPLHEQPQTSPPTPEEPTLGTDRSQRPEKQGRLFD